MYPEWLPMGRLLLPFVPSSADSPYGNTYIQRPAKTALSVGGEMERGTRCSLPTGAAADANSPTRSAWVGGGQISLGGSSLWCLLTVFFLQEPTEPASYSRYISTYPGARSLCAALCSPLEQNAKLRGSDTRAGETVMEGSRKPRRAQEGADPRWKPR